jgi:hypothetical protein
MVDSDLALRELVAAIVAGDSAAISHLLDASPHLAKISFEAGATRQSPTACFLDAIERYAYQGDTALHMAAAAYQAEAVGKLIAAGADVHAKNRHGDEALHSAAVGNPGSRRWNPLAQVKTITCLIKAGADPNAGNRTGISPLHRAVRTRCADALKVLLAHGADPTRKNKSGSTPLLLVRLNTGRGGSGSPEAKLQQKEILRLLGEKSPA